MAIKGHRFPLPLWNVTDSTIVFPKEMADKFDTDRVEAGDIVYAPNEQLLSALMEMKEGHSCVWSEKAVTRPFPKAVHGPGGQSLSVRSRDELKRALKVGWSEKPVVQESPAMMPPSPDRGPVGVDAA